MSKATIELITLFVAIGLAPLGPILAASYAGLAWESVALAAAWGVSWYVWLAARLRASRGRASAAGDS